MIETEAEFIAVMRQRDREAYCCSGNWFITYGGGRVSRSLIDDLRKRGVLRPVYSNTNDALWLKSQTIDIERSKEARRRHGRLADLVYVE